MPRRPPRPTYEELLARIAALEAEIDRLRADLAAARGEDEPPATGGGEVIAATAPVPTKKGRPAGVKANVVRLVRHRPRRPRAPVPGRRREVADRVVVHAPAVCGGCGAALTGGRLVGRRQVVEVPPVKAEVVEHQARERRCRCCGWAGRGAYDALLAEARASPVVHIDETHWREDGQNGYVWTVSTPTVRLFHYTKSRAGAVAERLLGSDGTAAVVSDFYGAYDRLARTQQRCWAHLLRDLHALLDDHPADRR